MKKVLIVVLGFAMVFTMIFAGSTKVVSAVGDVHHGTEGIADGRWVGVATSLTAKEVNVSSYALAPATLTLLTWGIKVTTAQTICHPFRGGQYGWVGHISEFSEGKWVNVPTTNAWVPNKEGLYMSCAKATHAGTYALFAVYDQELAP